MSRDEAFETILRLRNEYLDKASKIHRANEATTRLLLVNQILEALGWSRHDFNPETKSSAGGYIDYLLEADRVPLLIVEAKREGNTFASPKKRSQRSQYQLRYFRSAFGQDFALVIDQARRYAVDTGVPYALLTNGGEWLLVQLLGGPGVDINDLQGFYLGNIFADDFNFDLLWEVLCKDCVVQGSLEANLGSQNLMESDFCTVPQITLRKLGWHSETNSDQLWQLYDLFFDEIIDPGRRKMLEKCFVSNSKLDHFQAELQRALRDTSPMYLGVTESVELTPGEGDRLLAAKSGDKKGRVVIITGSVGCGKSTFVTRVLVDVKKEKKQEILALKLDLIDELVDEPSQVVTNLWRYITEEWKQLAREAYEHDVLRKIFGRQLLDLRQGPYKVVFIEDEFLAHKKEAELLEELVANPEEYFKAAWRYYQQKGQGVVLFLDNVDRASESYQQHVYSFAHKVARSTGATVIVTMREATFFRGRDSGFLDVRTDDIVFHLQSPNLLQLLSKRIKYVEEYIGDDHRLSRLRATRDWNSFYEFALSQCALLKEVFLKGSDDGSAILALLSATAWHDVRFFLKVLRHLHSQIGSSSKPWCLMEALAVLLATSEDGTSYLGNLYHPAFPSYKCYFLRLRILLFIQFGKVLHRSKRGAGFDEIRDRLLQYGYRERWIRRAIEELVQERFLECLEAPAVDDYTKSYRVSESHTFRSSPLAVVCIEENIVSNPVYLAIIGGDLPFHDRHRLAQYEAAVNEFSELLDNAQLSRDAIEILTETRAARVTAAYLSDIYRHEAPSINLAAHVPEIAAIEQRLQLVVRRLTNENTGVPHRKDVNNGNGLQLPLFAPYSEDVRGINSLPEALPIPPNITSIRLGQSELAILIFWALIYLRIQGKFLATGMEITQVINSKLVEEHDQKAPNNVSRALRSSLLRSQPWLVAQKGSARSTLFGVVDNWEDYWKQLFGEVPPSF